MCAIGNEMDSLIDLEQIESEDNDLESSPASYEIFTYPADYTLEGLVKLWNDDEIIVPPFQRSFVWSQTQSSRLIESFLLGLPVPPIFLYQQKEDKKFLVVDGQQRLTSVAYFFEGYFGEESKGKRTAFRLSGLHKKSPFLNKTYDDLEGQSPSSVRQLRSAVLRSFIIKQLNPQDDTSIYHIFARLNTGGTLLKGQEIRNCVYHGDFNAMLNDLNENTPIWREIIGKPKPDKRKQDIELILRFFALLHSAKDYQKPMTDFLSRYMAATRRQTTPELLAEYRTLFADTASAVMTHLGPKPFHVWSGLNIAVFDSVFPAFAKNLKRIPTDIKERFEKLVTNSDYIDWSRVRTTDDDIVTKRLQRANLILFGN